MHGFYEPFQSLIKYFKLQQSRRKKNVNHVTKSVLCNVSSIGAVDRKYINIFWIAIRIGDKTGECEE